MVPCHVWQPLSCSAARPSYFLSSFHRALLRSCALCLSIALSVLSSFSLSVLCFFACVALWGSCDCAVFVLLRARRLSWFLRSSLCLCGPWCFPCCLPSFVVVPVSVKVCVPYRVTTWLWCDLPFIEYLVVELDCGKMSATDLSSFDIAL